MCSAYVRRSLRLEAVQRNFCFRFSLVTARWPARCSRSSAHVTDVLARCPDTGSAQTCHIWTFMLPSCTRQSIDGPSIREWEGLCIQCFVMLIPVIVSLSCSTYHAVHILLMHSWPGGPSLRMRRTVIPDVADVAAKKH